MPNSGEILRRPAEGPSYENTVEFFHRISLVPIDLKEKSKKGESFKFPPLGPQYQEEWEMMNETIGLKIGSGKSWGQLSRSQNRGDTAIRQQIQTGINKYHEYGPAEVTKDFTLYSMTLGDQPRRPGSLRVVTDPDIDQVRPGMRRKDVPSPWDLIHSGDYQSVNMILQYAGVTSYERRWTNMDSFFAGAPIRVIEYRKGNFYCAKQDLEQLQEYLKGKARASREKVVNPVEEAPKELKKEEKLVDKGRKTVGRLFFRRKKSD